MNITHYDTREEWLAGRIGKITGSRLGKIVVKRGTGKKIGFYELIAERIGLPPEDNETPMDRGTRLEKDAIERFVLETGKKVDASLVIWQRADDPSIALSPDASVLSLPEAVEVKCLGSARHIEAWHTKEIPSEYEFQALQYFVVNDELETLNFCFYDPRIPSIDFFIIQIHRKDLEKEIIECLEYQRKELKEVNEIVNQLTF